MINFLSTLSISDTNDLTSYVLVSPISNNRLTLLLKSFLSILSETPIWSNSSNEKEEL